MSCPQSESIARLIAEDLPVAEARVLEQHLKGCTTCSQRRDDTVGLVSALGTPTPAQDGEAFVRDTLSRLGQGGRSTGGTPWKLVAAAAVVVVALPVGYLGWRQLDPGDRGTFAPRGQRAAAGPLSELSKLVGVEPLLVRHGHPARVLKQNQPLRPADRLTCRYSNLSRRSLHMMAFALDAAGELHWMYPAYLDEATDPRAVPLAAQARGRMMPDMVQPEGVAPGPLRVVTLVMTRPLTVKQVERLVQGRDPRKEVALFPAYVVTRQWLVRMEAPNE